MLLGILFRAALALADYAALHHHFGDKDLVMLRPGAAHQLVADIHRRAAKIPATAFCNRYKYRGGKYNLFPAAS